RALGSSRSPADGQFLDVVDLLRIAVSKFLRGYRQPKPRQPARQRRQRNLQFGACEVLPDALVYAIPETQVTPPLTGSIKDVRIVDETWVPVSRWKVHQEAVT